MNIDSVTILAALVGAMLGIVNTCWMIRRDRVHLCARYFQSKAVSTKTEGYGTIHSTYINSAWESNEVQHCGIEITNLGMLAASIETAAFKKHRKAVVGMQADHFEKDSTPLPFRLEARSGFQLLANAATQTRILDGTLREVTTACGITCRVRIGKNLWEVFLQRLF